MLPQACRQVVLLVGHDIPMAGHLGIAKTKNRILNRYYWPGIFKDIANYCRTCGMCQRDLSRKPARAEMIPMPVIDKPFRWIGMDIVGPLPRTQRGNRFVLVICDYATRYPEAIALPSAEAPRVARELIQIFARVSIPEEVLSDQGTNFMSTLLAEIYKLLRIDKLRTSQWRSQDFVLTEA